ncbi:MAG: alginate export family protein [Bacteroidota bacterium]
MKTWRYIIGFLCVVSAEASFSQTEEKEKSIFNFSLLRQDDAITIVDDGKKSWYESLKSIDLGKNMSLHFGGSYRFQTEAFVNEQFSTEEDQSDYWFLQRFQLFSHLKISDKFEFFVELNSSIIFSKDNLSPVDRDELSFTQLFAKYHFNAQWNFLIGRQNMRLGSGRLLDIREGPNVRLSFDMAQLQFENEKTKVTTFYAVPVRPEAGIFDNDILNFQETLATLYWTQHWNATTNTDVYLMYKEEDDKTWNAGTANDERLSIGLRHFGNWGKLRYNNEFVYQTGNFGNQNINAWTASVNIEHAILICSNDATIGLKTELISGDTDVNDNTLNTFDGLYPRGAYFGRVARLGPSNLFDIHPYVATFIGKFSLEFDYVAFWRFSNDDGVYSPPLILEYPSVNSKRFIGHQVGSIAGFEVNSFITLELETNLIFPGSFLKESGLNDTLFHTVVTAEFKF